MSFSNRKGSFFNHNSHPIYCRFTPLSAFLTTNPTIPARRIATARLRSAKRSSWTKWPDWSSECCPCVRIAFATRGGELYVAGARTTCTMDRGALLRRYGFALAAHPHARGLARNGEYPPTIMFVDGSEPRPRDYWPVTSRQHTDSKMFIKFPVTDYSIRPPPAGGRAAFRYASRRLSPVPNGHGADAAGRHLAFRVEYRETRPISDRRLPGQPKRGLSPHALKLTRNLIFIGRSPREHERFKAHPISQGVKRDLLKL